MDRQKQEEWVRTTCYMCYSCCGIRVRVVDGTVVAIEGDPENPHNQGKLCAKGRAGIASLYDPYRVKTPLKRTNPNKGIGIDPGWQEITWDEALAIVAERLKKIRQDDPRKLVLAGLDFHFSYVWSWFASAFGTRNIWFGGADYYCGNGLHPITYLTLASLFVEPDVDNCNYCMLIGSQMGFMVKINAVTLATKMADARSRGLKVVVVDPVGTNAAAKADEWVPIRPGTDSAFVLSMLNVLVNELGIYDRDFLKTHTNSPYLVGPDGLYVRDELSGKPLVWDEAAGQAQPFDSPSVKVPALAGEQVINGSSCWPAFELFKKHLTKYVPEQTEEITTVPATTVRRLAREFGEAARVGSTIVIQGKEVPFRPVAATWNRGIAHKGCMMAGHAIQLLNMVVGALDVPGGLMGINPVGPWWGPKEAADGLLFPAPMHLLLEPAFPARPVGRPETLELRELFPVASYSSPLFEESMLQPDKFGLPYRPEMLMHVHSNVMMSTAGPKRMAEVLKKFPYIVSFAIQLDETVEFADLVLPDTHYLERMVPFPNRPSGYLSAGESPWFWLLARPAVPPAGSTRPWLEVMIELADRVGIRENFLSVFNVIRNLKEPYKLDPAKKYTWEEIIDAWAKSWFGPEHDLNWFKSQSLLITGEKKVEEAYPRPFLKPRAPLYLEHFINAGKEVERVTREMGIHWDTSNYRPLPDWVPCPGHNQNEEGSLFLVNYKLPFHTFSATAQNPWLNDLAERHPHAYKMLIHPAAAARNNVKDGDLLWVESPAGRVKAVARVSECVHPEVVAVAGTFGHWAKSMPVAFAKGTHYNSLIPWSMDRIDTVSAALDGCVRVKLYPAQESS